MNTKAKQRRGEEREEERYTRYVSISDKHKGDPTRTSFPENWMKRKLHFQRVGWVSLGVLEPPRAVEMVQKRVLYSGEPLHLLVE